jgi:hypothetical protein
VTTIAPSPGADPVARTGVRPRTLNVAVLRAFRDAARRRALDARGIARYDACVTIVAFLRRIGRKLQPPGNRGPLGTEYRQPNSPTAVDPGDTPRPHTGLDGVFFG